MNFMFKIALASVAMVVVAGSAQAGSACRRAGGEATMITEDLAKFMSNAALKNALAAHKWTAHGAVTTKCDSAAGLPHCVSRQRACG